MTKIIKSIFKKEYKLDEKLERLFVKHPMLGLLLVFVGMPTAILMAVFLCTFLIAMPVSILLGWV